MSTSRRREEPYHHGDLRRALIDAAARLVRRHGAAGVSLREAARAAGVSHAAPYRHFDSLDALLAAVATEGFDDFRAALETAGKRAPPKSRLTALGRAYLKFALENPRLYRLMFGDDLGKAHHAELNAAADRAFAVLMGASANRVGAIRSWALVHGLSELILDNQIRRDDPVVAELFAV